MRSARAQLVVITPEGATGLRDASAFVGYQGPMSAPTRLLLRHHGLHVELHIDRNHPIGASDAAGISDLVLESALSTIQDLEDSVAAVDAQDKLARLSQLAGLMRGTLEARFPKGGASADPALERGPALYRRRRRRTGAARAAV